MATSVDSESILALIDKHQDSRGAIIAVLEDIQAFFNYLPKKALEIVALKTGHSLVDLYGIATFYSAFSLKPRGEHLVSVCTGTACHVRGASEVLDGFESALQVKPGETTDDESFTLTTVNCLGACALGPVAVMDGEYCSNVIKSDVPHLIRRCRDADLMSMDMAPEEMLQLHALCPHCNRSLMTSEFTLDGHPMIHVTISFGEMHGWLRLSSVLGDHRIQSKHEVPENTPVNLFCPHCHAELRSPSLCPKCDAPSVPLLNKKGGVFTLCSRNGCKEQRLELL
jgi:NADH-quinone oxidoreductase subunit E